MVVTASFGLILFHNKINTIYQNPSLCFLFSPCQQLNHHSVAAFLFFLVSPPTLGWKTISMFVYKKKCDSCKTATTMRDSSFLRDCACVWPSNGRKYCLKKISFFSSPCGFYCQKSENHSLWNTKGVQWERPMARSAQMESPFLLPLFLFSLLWLIENALSGI